MYIADEKIEFFVNGHDTAVITLKDVTNKDIGEIHDLYLKGSDVTLMRKDNGISNTTIPFPDSLRRYAERDVINSLRYYKTVFNRHEVNVTMRNLKVEKVIFNEPATIVFWNDNSKTVAVCSNDDKYDIEKGFYICCAKKLFGNDFKAGGKINKALEKAIVQRGNSVPQTGGIDALRKAFEEAEK